MHVLIIHGPNLELLGQREPDVYGEQTLAEINEDATALGRELGVEVTAVQFGEEKDIIAAVAAAAAQRYDGIIINPAAYTHTSQALGTALAGCGLPYVEVHLSNPYGREAFRRRSHVAAAALARVMGFRGDSYLFALRGLVAYLGKQNRR